MKSWIAGFSYLCLLVESILCVEDGERFSLDDAVVVGWWLVVGNGLSRRSGSPDWGKAR